jgi:hypothetical protein
MVAIDFDMSPRAWAGERECAGKAAIYRGPLLLAYEPAGNAAVPTLDLSLILAQTAPADLESISKVDIRDAKGVVVRLRDYGTAGANRRPYVSWIPAKNVQAAPFSHANPQRTLPVPLKLK